MGEFGSNNEDNERKEKTSERAREREGGGERGRALVRAGVEKGKGKKKERTLLLRERSFPPHRPSFPSLPFLLSERKYVKNTCKKLRERLFLNPEPGGGLRTKRQERERTAEVEG
jgi:hypothetical protein